MNTETFKKLKKGEKNDYYFAIIDKSFDNRQCKTYSFLNIRIPNLVILYQQKATLRCLKDILVQHEGLGFSAISYKGDNFCNFQGPVVQSIIS